MDATAARRVLVLGFGPFLDVSDNPAAALARALDGRVLTLRSGGRVQVVGREMPVSHVRAPALAETLAREIGAELVLGVGVARGRSAAALERRGVRAPSRADPPPPDVDGVVVTDLGALAGDAAAHAVRYATLPEVPFCAASGVGTSEDAGSYVCNGWLWATLGRLRDRPVGFLHIPDVPDPLDGPVLAGLRAVLDAREGAPLPAPERLCGAALPARLPALLGAIAVAGGRAFVVGGGVRDLLRGATRAKDVDLEVHRLPLEPLHSVLRGFGRVDEVGRSFGVLKLRLGGTELDVSIPRRDSKAGAGHKGIRADADPHLGEVEAARRRDLTVNAIAWDPLSNEVIDPFGGLGDLGQGLLRAVDAGTFGEDPLRALRVAQFAGRLGAEVDPMLAELCVAAPLAELPPERIRGEVEKLLLKARAPSVGWEVARATGAWAKVLPAWDHPAPATLDAVAAVPLDSAPRRLALLLAAASRDEAALVDVLDRLRVFRQDGVRVRELATFLVRRRAAACAPVSDEDLRRWADEGDLALLAVLAEASGARGLRARASALGWATMKSLPPVSPTSRGHAR